MIASLLLTLTQLTSLTNDVEAQQVVLSSTIRFDSLNRLRSLREESGATRWIARDIAGRAQGETTLNLLGAAQAARIHHNDGYRRIATSQASGPKRFVYGRSLDELLFQEQGSSQLSPVVSQLGSTMKLLNAAGGIADQFRYDAFGAPLTGDSAGFSHLFAGAIYDSKAKLYDLRHRHYDPQIGRFLSRDPLGAHADPVNAGNAYAYVGNNPLNRRDPLGLLTGDGFLDWLDKKAQWLNQKAWDAAWGVHDGVDAFLDGALEGLQETQRSFDDFMSAGMMGEPRSQIGKRIAANEKQGSSLPVAIAKAAADTVVETIEDTLQVANHTVHAAMDGDMRTTFTVGTALILGALTPGPDGWPPIRKPKSGPLTAIGPGRWKEHCREIAGFADIPTIEGYRSDGLSRMKRVLDGRPLALTDGSGNAWIASSASRGTWKNRSVLSFNLGYNASAGISPQELAKAAKHIWENEFLGKNLPKPRLLSISIWDCANAGTVAAKDAMTDLVAGLNAALSKDLGVQVKLYQSPANHDGGLMRVIASLHYPK